MKKTLTLLLLILFTITLSACGVSPEEKEQRRADAFDIAGTYQINEESNLSETSLEIKNESDRSNVFGIIDRDDFSKEEQKAFANQNIPLNKVDKFRTRFQLGAGKHNSLEGGENISDDRGNSSRLFIVTNKDESLTINNDTIKYSVVATVEKSSFVLKGKIVMTIERVTEKEGKITITNLERVEIPFTAKNNMSFFHQYIGIWEGKMIISNETIGKALSSITIREIDSENFEVTSAQSEFSFNGEIYKLTNTVRSIDELSKNEFPKIYLEFASNKKSKIAMMGNIYSLGMYSGVVAKIDSGGNNEQIGNFQYKRR